MPIDFGRFESTIEHEVVYPHPRERVWRALSESDVLAAWLMDNDLSELEPGATFEFRDDPVPLLWDGTVRCEVMVVEPPERLRLSWDGGGLNRETTVSWKLTTVESGTRLRFRHEGFDGFRGLLMKQGLLGGWASMYDESLPAVLAHLAAGDDLPPTSHCRDRTTGPPHHGG